jgi:broad specificity phosphatase PhoE
VEPTRLWFARHGEVEEKWVGAFIGKTDVPLSDLGRHQAAAIAAYLEDAPIDAIVCSPRKRALDTAAPLAKAKGLKLDVRPAFAEMDFGAWDGLFWPDIVAKDSAGAERWMKHFMTDAIHGGESGLAFSERVRDGLARVLEEFKGRSVAVVGHSGVSRAILAATIAKPYDETFAFATDYGSVNAAAWSGSGEKGEIALWNFVPGPRAKRQGEN